MRLESLITFYHRLTPESLAQLTDFYAKEAYFKDPFNEVRGVDAIRKIFEHMFQQVAEPRFFVTEHVADGSGAMLVWEFHFRMRWPRSSARLVRGVSHLKFNTDGQVTYHRDYWDAAEELYMTLPGLGLLLRGLRRAIRA
ncbi:MAG: nuclear transport factor 2 family protein [Candidatus Accumulibacter sp.]|nr:nuclear transport factor 2 family protein [Accumulibacter sp.]